MKALVSGQPSLLLCRTRSRAAATRAANFPCPSSSSSSSLSMVALSQSNLPIANQGLVLGLGCALTRRRTTPPVANAQSLPGYTDDGDDHDTSSFASASDALFRLQPGGVRSQLILLALPAVLGQAIDPLAQLMETAYIGRLGALELASAGIGVAIFNILSKIFNIPLLSIATSFVAEDISKNASKHSSSGKLELPSVSSALILAAGIGIIEALALFLGSGLFLKLMGVSPASPMHKSAQLFLSLRALGAPANVIMLAVQGIFRGFKDTKTPVFYIGLGNLSAVVLLPLLIYGFGLGITGAAISTVASQYIIAILLLWSLSKRAVLLPPMMEQLEFSGYLKSGRPYHRNKTHNRCSTKFIRWFAGFQLSALKQPTSSINTSNGSLLIRSPLQAPVPSSPRPLFPHPVQKTHAATPHQDWSSCPLSLVCRSQE